ncbi:MAG: YjfB family protein [Nitrospinae bacterium]|nr:YjfB family protein [Nitrospinota bacterium]
MESSAVGGTGGLAPAQQASGAGQANVAVQKKALDMAKAQGAQLVDMIQKSGATFETTA